MLTGKISGPRDDSRQSKITGLILMGNLGEQEYLDRENSVLYYRITLSANRNSEIQKRCIATLFCRF